ncbi:MAG: hypothetical protein B7Z55_08860, partial [Planctomycetales bacterium 12-60-4]
IALRYTEDDLRRMIDKLAGLYEMSSSFQEFVGFSVVRNHQSEVEEDSFRYLHRHTVGRPRDMVIVCHEISHRRNQLSETVYREVVNDVSAQVIVRSVFDEMRPLIEGLDEKRERQKLFALLPYNILTLEEIKTLCCRFNDVECANYDDIRVAGDALHHPFCELYNCGLLGVIRQDPHSGSPFQYFKQPQDALGDTGSCLPRSPFYLLHPSLQSLINQQHAGIGYQTFRFVTVGHRYPWRPHFAAMVAVQRASFTIRECDLREAMLGHLRSINEILQVTDEGTAKTTDAEFETILSGTQDCLSELERLGYDDAFLTLDDLAKRYLRSRRDSIPRR